MPDLDRPSAAPAGLPPALLAFEDGTIYRGLGFGAAESGAGEIVFNTAMTGYQEVLTDPSYRGQIITMTAPEIGNVGVNREDFESERLWCAGFVVRDLSPVVSSWRAEGSLHDLSLEHGIPGITGIDTRAVTRRLRDGGAQRAVITRDVDHPAAAVERARRHPSLEGRDLVCEVTCAKPYTWDEPMWVERWQKKNVTPATRHVVAYDFGIKRGILRCLRSAGCRITVVPATTPAREVLAMKPDGVFLSNGPADPAAVGYGIEAARALVEARVPMFGICLGHQILGLALGGKTYKLKFGHHGANHPVMDLTTSKVEITSQNHGFAVDVESLQGRAVLSHINLNDRTVEGMRHDSLPVFSVQYHPEASPGPNDPMYLFQRFTKLIDERHV